MTGHAATATTQGSHVSLRNLTKRFGDSAAVDDISLDVEPGEILALLGPSGSGKTTTLNIVAGFTPQDAGLVMLDGIDVGQVPSRQRGIGMVFQHYALFPHMTVAQNIAFPLQQRRVPRQEQRERVDAAIETVRLTGYANRKPHELSGGQQQRVALARAIVFGPGLLLMDEPLGALDRGLRESMQDEIRRIQREIGSTVIIVTHDQEEALGLADRIAVFRDGAIVQVGTGEDLYARPRSLFVGQFLGESTVFAGELAAGASSLTWRDQAIQVSETTTSGSAAVIVRPEVARVSAVSDAPVAGVNSVVGKLLDDVYLGASRRITVDIGLPAPAIARMSTSADPFRPGDPVTFTWSPSEALVVAA